MNEEEIPPEKQEPIIEENWKDKYLHTLAEMENMRKRMQKEKYETSKFGIESIISDFLTPLDNFENALRLAGNASGDVKNWAIGFEMILSQFKEVLHAHGITSFPSVGTQFNPLLHEAVEIVETDETPDGIIIQEFNKGYKSSLRTIRPARVKVAKKAPQSQETQKEEETL